MMTICTFNARTLASKAFIKDLMVQARKISYDEDEIEAFYMDLEKFYREDHTFYKVIVGDFNAKIGPRRTPEELHIGTHGLQWNEQGERLSEFIMTTRTIHGNSNSRSQPSYGGRGSHPVESIIMKSTTSSSTEAFCLTDVGVVPKFYTGSDHRLLRARFFFSRKGEKAAKYKKRSPKPTISWDIFTTLAGFWEDPLSTTSMKSTNSSFSISVTVGRKPRV
ncbi:hypothetical protein Y032_0130g1527 [Ancylostoma ceylanicum]|uniref:Endonuclease/exonuclease/phosphatase domain-containing protein n=1 Tax=Ancylostoma ceylanicum TaxID=53326 RepID=A0A016T6I3_9BILA|nr:hypothetical protein Y032_0130g1527 [Ancylostoma ceylanicum]